jgi:hypothetical protein
MFGMMLYVLIALTLCLLYWSSTGWETNRIIWWLVIFLIPFIPFAIERFRPHVVIGDAGISVTYSVWGLKRRTYSWKEIEKVQGKWETEVEVVPCTGPSVQILFYQLPKKQRTSLRQDLHKYLGDRVKVEEIP